ncbi:MAG: cyclodeaminase/cyclohydrolase family protein [Trebonia sp.]
MRDDTVTAYLGRLAERTAAPAGGATAAVNAAQAAALLAMTARCCDGPARAGHAETIGEVIGEADRLRYACVALMAVGRLLELARTPQPMVNRYIAPDVAAAAEATRAAIATSRTNMEANLAGITDPAARDRLTRVITGTAALEAGAEQVIAAVRAGYA